ncbi:homeodomain-interacting protein kinase 2-like [Eucyclogobius newberryi]|uniref:homeodomain-interacting protein kinase 2-like n=1 Tax=Eucyclogobius newberryi TaxID=166745 RepID=UPI003B59F036
MSPWTPDLSVIEQTVCDGLCGVKKGTIQLFTHDASPTQNLITTWLKSFSLILGKVYSYFQKLKGEGSYGCVVQGINCWTSKMVAIKISPLKNIRETKNEVYALKTLSSQSKNVVKFIQYFQSGNNCCLVMEHLDHNLYDLMKRRQCKPLDLSHIRYITEQLLEAFEELEKHKLVHGDLKPDNIMLVNHKLEPFNIKLIDFGLSSTVGKLVPGSFIQTMGYRAPEVSLGTELDGAVDMWSVGCVLAFLFMGNHLFPINCEYEMIRIITQIQGIPDVPQLKKGRFTGHFFKETNGRYSLISPIEYTCKTRQLHYPWRHVSKEFTSLNSMAGCRLKSTLDGKMETRRFFDLLNKILHVNSDKRITPGKALTHPFIKKTSNPRKSIKSHLKGTEMPHQTIVGRKNCKKTARKRKRLSKSEDKSPLETNKVKRLKIQERVPTTWIGGVVEIESDNDYEQCSKAEQSVKTVQVQPVIQNEPGRKVTRVGRSLCKPKCGNRTKQIKPK